MTVKKKKRESDGVEVVGGRRRVCAVRYADDIVIAVVQEWTQLFP